MSVLILFASVEGQSRKIAHFVNDLVKDAGHDTVVEDANEIATLVPLEGVERVILAASVHERRHPKAFEVLVAANAEALNALPLLMLSVSLSAAFPEGHDEAQDYLTEMKMRTGLDPAAEALVAGAVRTGSYDYYATQVVRHVVMRDRPVEDVSDEHEFTDWADLTRRVTGFLPKTT